MPPSATPATMLARLRGLYARHPQASDAELLRLFARQGDAAAFEQLVGRHAPLVWGACRRILPGEADREDAFQATFLALVRQAGRLDPDRPLGGWLHTVAVRVARKAAVRARQQFPLTLDRPTPGDIAGDVGTRELLRMVDEEIERLPAAVRGPVVLCCLEGRTRDEAAEALGCSVAAVKGRLERGRGLLRRRLERRGVELPAAFLVLGLTGGRVRASLRAQAVQAALGTAPPAVAALAAAAVAPLPGKLILAAVALLAAGAAGLGAFGVSGAAAPPRDRYGDPLPDGAVRRFGTLRFRHPEVFALAFTPDGKELVAGVGMSPLAVFDAATGRKLREVGKQSPNNYAGFALSPDGSIVASCGFDVFLWDLRTGHPIRELGCGRCSATTFSPDGARIAAVTEERAEFQVVEAATGKRLASWKFGGAQTRYDVRSLAFTIDGRYVGGVVSEMRMDRPGQMTVGAARYRLWDAADGQEVGSFGSDDDPVYDSVFQPGTGHLVSATAGAAIRFRDPKTGRELRRLTTPKGAEPLFGLCFSADGTRLAFYARGGRVLVLDAAEGRELRRIEVGDNTSSPVVLALSADGKAVAYGRLYGDTRVRVWDVDTGSERFSAPGHHAPVKTVELTDGGHTLVSRDGWEKFSWNLTTGAGRSEADDRKDTPHGRSWTTEGDTVVGPRWRVRFRHEKAEVEIQSLDGAKVLRTIDGLSWGTIFDISPDGTHLAAVIRERRSVALLLWNPEREEQPRRLLAHPDGCEALLFSADGKRLIAGAVDYSAYPRGHLWVWDVATGAVVHKMPSASCPRPLVAANGGRWLIAGSRDDAAVRVWDLETGRSLAVLADPQEPAAAGDVKSKPSATVTSILLSPDERFLAAVVNHGETYGVTVWEVGSWKPIRSFAPTRPTGWSYPMTFARDGRSLFVANSDATILEWDVAGRLAAPPKNLWAALLDAPDQAYPAMWAALDRPAEAVGAVGAELKPAEPVDGQRVRDLLAKLDATAFREREAANRQLLALGEAAVPAIRAAMDGLAPEAKARAEKAVESLSAGPTAEQQRPLRAVAVLEWSGSAEADDHLRRLAGGDPTARLTRAAVAALKRREGHGGPER